MRPNNSRIYNFIILVYTIGLGTNKILFVVQCLLYELHHSERAVIWLAMLSVCINVLEGIYLSLHVLQTARLQLTGQFLRSYIT